PRAAVIGAAHARTAIGTAHAGTAIRRGHSWTAIGTVHARAAIRPGDVAAARGVAAYPGSALRRVNNMQTGGNGTLYLRTRRAVGMPHK
ncbi:MAG: hypothetical protein WCF79_16715, partial [Rhodomicrobium sp.]